MFYMKALNDAARHGKRLRTLLLSGGAAGSLRPPTACHRAPADFRHASPQRRPPARRWKSAAASVKVESRSTSRGASSPSARALPRTRPAATSLLLWGEHPLAERGGLRVGAAASSSPRRLLSQSVRGVETMTLHNWSVFRSQHSTAVDDRLSNIPDPSVRCRPLPLRASCSAQASLN